MGLDVGAYLRQLKQLLPTGDALNKEPNSILSKVLEAMADELGRVDSRMEQLKLEWDPRSTSETLVDWERVYGLPDPCITDTQTEQQRRDALVAKIALLGGQSRQFFIDLAESLGYTVTITEFAVALSGAVHSGDFLYDYDWAHAWSVDSALLNTVTYFDCNSVCSESLASWGNDQLECAVQERSPAHTVLSFTYGAQYNYLREGFGHNFATDFHYFRPVAGAPTVTDFESIWANSRSGPAMYRRADGVYAFADENLYSDTQNISGTGWFVNGVPTVTLNARIAPDGTMTADLIESSGGTTGVYHGAPTISVGHLYTWWAVVKNDLDADNLNIGSDNTPANATVTFNTVTGLITATGANVVESGVVAMADGWFLVWGACISTGTGLNCIIYAGDASLMRWQVAGIGLRAGFGPVTVHLPNTTAAALYKKRINYNLALNDGVRRLLVEPGTTVRSLWDRDLTNAAWTKTNMTPVKTVTGIDGRANSATRLTATAGNATVLQAMVNGSQARRFNPFVRRVTGTGNIDITLDGGATWTTKAITGTWSRIAIGQTLADPSVGFRIVTNGDVIEVDACGCQDGTYDLSPLFTTTTAITRGGESPSRVFGAEYDTTKGSVACKFICYGDNVGSANAILSRDTASHHLRVIGGNTVNMTDGTSSITTSTFTPGALVKAASSFGAVGGLLVTHDAIAPITAAYDGSWGAGASIYLGNRAGVLQLGGEIEWIIYRPVEEVDTWTIAYTT